MMPTAKPFRVEVNAIAIAPADRGSFRPDSPVALLESFRWSDPPDRAGICTGVLLGPILLTCTLLTAPPAEDLPGAVNGGWEIGAETSLTTTQPLYVLSDPTQTIPGRPRRRLTTNPGTYRVRVLATGRFPDSIPRTPETKIAIIAWPEPSHRPDQHSGSDRLQPLIEPEYPPMDWPAPIDLGMVLVRTDYTHDEQWARIRRDLGDVMAAIQPLEDPSLAGATGHHIGRLASEHGEYFALVADARSMDDHTLAVVTPEGTFDFRVAMSQVEDVVFSLVQFNMDPEDFHRAATDGVYTGE